MIPVTDPRLEAYMLELTPESDPAILEMEKKARETGVPIVSRPVGRFLSLMTYLKQPNLVVELGSGFGYSAYWFARAMRDRGKVVLTDYSERHMEYARRVFDEAGLSCRAEFRVGDALQIGREYGTIDLLFIDLDKYLYPEAIRVMLPNLAKNAVVIADNALWRGAVVEGGEGKKDAAAIREFNEFMCGHEDFFATIVPVGDGVLLASKISP